MILVDSSVWIAYCNGVRSPKTDRLDALLDEDIILTGDLILAEVLRGFRSERDFKTARALFADLECVTLGGRETALAAVDHYRALRAKGHTVRKTVDCLIAAFCIARRLPLLHDDRDFDPFVRHRGLVAA